MRPMVMFPFNLSKHVIRQPAEVRAFRDVLMYQSVCVFIRAMVRTCEIILGSEPFRNLLVEVQRLDCFADQ